MKNQTLDIKKLVARFGGRMELWRRMNARGYKLSVKTIEKWGERNSVPSPRIMELLELATYEKHPINLNDYLVRSAPNAGESLSHRHEKQKSKVVPR
ncbi:hypothetical protein UFOVP549_38 [uncultured Caudovirales phage]|uniref:Uncharacterized protein n=1 Tax=uncultured Caudovirales phage TaxID=2100421 RepID=A0A6J5MYL5_9CAUD|nr:hypothetical protein UFOVP549_38 [uncultured Caudovirales phage]